MRVTAGNSVAGYQVTQPDQPIPYWTSHLQVVAHLLQGQHHHCAAFACARSPRSPSLNHLCSQLVPALLQIVGSLLSCLMPTTSDLLCLQVPTGALHQ